MIARCDRKPIAWPTPTHGSGLKPYRTAAEIIDWSIPCPSIFDSAEQIKEHYGVSAVRPLAENTLRRIARGMQKFIIDNPDPFIIPIGYGERAGQAPRVQGINKPLSTIVSSGKQYLCAPALIQYHGETAAAEARGQLIDKPIMTLDASPRYGLVTAFMSKYFSGGYTGSGNRPEDPLSTVTAFDHNSVVATHMCVLRNNMDGKDLREPMPTIMTSPGHFAEVRAFLVKYYGQGTGQGINEPLDTIVSRDRFGIVTIHGTDYAIVDIGLRMLTPRELYNAQGFPLDYVIDHDYTGKAYPKSKQVARCGNSVPPPFAEALVRANIPELACNRKLNTMGQLIKEIAV